MALTRLSWVLIAFALMMFAVARSHAQNSPPAAFLSDVISSRNASSAAGSNGNRSQPVKENSGPRIDHYITRSGRPEIEKVTFPEASPGQKIVVVRLPESENGRIDLDRYQVSLRFFSNRVLGANASCNAHKLFGDVEELAANDREYPHYLKVNYRAGKSSTTLKACLHGNIAERPVEIITELSSVRPFRDNLVLYVPEDVDVQAQVWTPAMQLRGVAP